MQLAHALMVFCIYQQLVKNYSIDLCTACMADIVMVACCGGMQWLYNIMWLHVEVVCGGGGIIIIYIMWLVCLHAAVHVHG